MDPEGMSEFVNSAPNLIGAGMEALVANANRLGLTWTLRMATVTISTSADPDLITAVYDGDSGPIIMTSMVGALSIGARVYVISIPPSGNFIVGRIVTACPYYARTTVDAATITSVTFTNIPSFLRSLTLRWTARSSGTGGGGLQATRVQINGNVSTNYGGEYIQAAGAAVASALLAGETSMFIGNHTNATASANLYGLGECTFVGWDEPHPYISCVFTSHAFAAGGNYITGGSNFFVTNIGYTSLTIFPASGSWVQGSDFQLEGLPS